MALMFFSALTTFALIGWFKGAGGAVWTWKSVLTLGCTIVAAAASGLVWSAPSRRHAFLGIGVMLFSLLRIGGPSGWTWVSFAIVAMTFVLLMPLVHAAMVLRDD